MIKNKTILVTGGAGFIGSHFVEQIIKTNNVIVYDNFSSSVISVSDLSHLSNLGNLKVIKGDILDKKQLAKAMKGVDMVFHFAVACVRLSLSQERFVHDVNATGTLNTLLAARNAKVKRFIYISSSEVYGTTRGKLISETHPITPMTVYGMSKYMGELYTKEFNDHEGLPSMIIRPFNSYGPREHFDGVYGEVIPRFVIQALNDVQPTIFGSGKQTRDFTFVKDTALGIYKAAQCDKVLGDVINIAYGKEVSINAIAETIYRSVGIAYSPTLLDPRPNDVDRLAANTEKAKLLLSYSPKIDIQKGLAMYISWMKHTYPNPKKLTKFVPNTNW
jgi:UDP-glucose 4-epimerase